VEEQIGSLTGKWHLVIVRFDCDYFVLAFFAVFLSVGGLSEAFFFLASLYKLTKFIGGSKRGGYPAFLVKSAMDSLMKGNIIAAQ